ncbi:MAG: hypothetical protein FWE37_02265 [Spirochaetaceae bacterium]|nr:hypothetical protein [Spirochaetaceae bacterium]
MSFNKGFTWGLGRNAANDLWYGAERRQAKLEKAKTNDQKIRERQLVFDNAVADLQENYATEYAVHKLVVKQVMHLFLRQEKIDNEYTSQKAAQEAAKYIKRELKPQIFSSILLNFTATELKAKPSFIPPIIRFIFISFLGLMAADLSFIQWPPLAAIIVVYALLSSIRKFYSKRVTRVMWLKMIGLSKEDIILFDKLPRSEKKSIEVDKAGRPIFNR